MKPPDRPLHHLVSAARSIITEAACYRLEDGRLAVSPASVAALQTALAVYEALFQTASAHLLVSDGTTLLLEACLRLPSPQARRLAERVSAACQGQTLIKKKEPPVIHFYRASGPYGFLSNFARSPFHLDGYLWPTVEHYYQAQKFAGSEHEHLIRRAASPALAAHLGRDPTRPRRPDWAEVREEVLRRAVLAKFSQNRRLRAQLLATGSATLVERTRRDTYGGGDGHGQNRLGRLLMQVRDQLRQEEVANDHAAEP